MRNVLNILPKENKGDKYENFNGIACNLSPNKDTIIFPKMVCTFSKTFLSKSVKSTGSNMRKILVVRRYYSEISGIFLLLIKEFHFIIRQF